MATTPFPKGHPIPYAPTDASDLYPAEDGKPMAVSDYHRRILIRTLEVLEEHFLQMPEIYVSGDILMYYVEGSAEISFTGRTGLFRFRQETPKDLSCLGRGEGA